MCKINWIKLSIFILINRNFLLLLLLTACHKEIFNCKFNIQGTNSDAVYRILEEYSDKTSNNVVHCQYQVESTPLLINREFDIRYVEGRNFTIKIVVRLNDITAETVMFYQNYFQENWIYDDNISQLIAERILTLLRDKKFKTIIIKDIKTIPQMT